MLDRPRKTTLSWAALCAGLFALLSVLVTQDWAPLVELDQRGKPAQGWAANQVLLGDVLQWIEDGFGTLAMTIYTAVLAVALFLIRQRRAAYFAVIVMLVTAVTTTGLKILLARSRPDWQNPVDILGNNSFPSGHASSIAAFAGIVIVLLVMLGRRAVIRRTGGVVIVLVALAVAADRVLLGRHFPSDVVAGALVGAFFVLVTLALYSPLPRGHAVSAEPLSEVFVSSRRLAVIVNPIKIEDVGQFRYIVSAMAADAGWSEPTWHYTTVEDPGGGMAEAAAVAGADLVLVCGGDGTVREVCAELAGTGIPVGIIPAGTGNLLARNLEIPLYLRSAIDVVLNGQDRAIDLVAVSGDGIEDTHFMVMAGMGFDAALMEGVNEGIKKRIGWLAYVIAGLRSLMFPVVGFEVSVDGAPFTRHRARSILVGNVGYLQAGMPLLPDAAIDDGLLDAVLLHPRHFLSWIPLAFRVVARRSKTDETINRMTGASIVLRAAWDTPRQLDGDSIGAGRELRMECIHGKLLVRVPR